MTRKAASIGATGGLTTEPLRPASTVAIAAVLVGVFSILCPPAGVVAMVLGALALREVRRSGGRRSGRRLAALGLGIGAATTTLTAGLVVWLFAQAAAPAPGRVHPAGASQVSSAPEDLLFELEAPDRSDGPPPITETRVQTITLVEVSPTVSRSLRAELEAQHRVARQGDDILLLWLVVPDCAPCESVARALPDLRMQQALSDVRLVRLDVRDFAVELSHMNVPLDAFPGFALIDGDARAIDYLHGGEWDEDVPENIAPVLKSFVRGTYHERRHPWRGGPREDETPI